MTTQELVPVAVRDLPVEIARTVRDQHLPESIVRAAITQAWPQAYKEQGFAAIASALVMCSTYKLDPLADHVYVAKFSAGWKAMISGHGLTAMANRRSDFDGAEVVRTWTEGGLINVEVNAYRKDRRLPAVGHGYKKSGDAHAIRKATTMAIRWALRTLYEGVRDDDLTRVLAEDPEHETPTVASQLDATSVEVEVLVEAEDVGGENPPQATPPTSPPTSPPKNAAQRRKLFALCGELGYDDATRKSEAGRILGRPISSFNELSSANESQLIDEFTAELDARHQAEMEAPFDKDESA